MWGTLATFLLSIVGSLAGRVLVSLGLGMVSYAGLNVLLSGVIAQVNASYGATGGVVLQLLNMAGAGQAIAILTAALVTRTALIAATKITSVTGLSGYSSGSGFGHSPDS
ncbi:MAG: DUF2523 domain-containing protein [Methylobacter sp.]|nr:DUF2523 domain-containing protein [Methylobacter sp.]